MKIQFKWVNPNDVYTSIDIYRSNEHFEYSEELVPHLTITEKGVNEITEEVSQNLPWYYMAVIRNKTDFVVGPIKKYTEFDTGPGPTEVLWSYKDYDFYGVVGSDEFLTHDEFKAHIGALTTKTTSFEKGPYFFKVGWKEKILFVSASPVLPGRTFTAVSPNSIYGRYKSPGEPVEPYSFVKDGRRYTKRLPLGLGYPSMTEPPVSGFSTAGVTQVSSTSTKLARRLVNTPAANALLEQYGSEFADLISVITGYGQSGEDLGRKLPLPVGGFPIFVLNDVDTTLSQDHRRTGATANFDSENKVLTVGSPATENTLSSALSARSGVLAAVAKAGFTDTEGSTSSNTYLRLSFSFWFILELEKD